MDKEDIPNKEIYSRTTVFKDMHSRKRLMAEAVFRVALEADLLHCPSGYGTFEELMEVVTWDQLGIHNRGKVVLNVDEHWDGLMDRVSTAVDAGFVDERNQRIIATDVEAAIDALKRIKLAKRDLIYNG